jgi:Tol biopolymer transport system component
MKTRLSSLAAALAFLAGCPEPVSQGGPNGAKVPASSPSSQASGSLTPNAPRANPEVDADYVVDGPLIPGRVGARRAFLRHNKLTLLRDPVFLPGGKEIMVVAKAGGVLGLYRMPVDGSTKAELVQPTPRFDGSAPRTASNRNNWYLGTPRVFPDGAHLLFDGSTPNPHQQWPNVLGIAPVSGGVVAAVLAKGAKAVRTPDVHPDGKTVIFAACDELRIGQLEGRGDQELETTVLLKLAPPEGAADTLCTMHRPRFSKDGKQVAFEVIGRHLPVELRDRYQVPEPLNEGDGLIEPWIMNADGTGVRRLVSDEAYLGINGRLQAGGSKEPEFSPDGQSVVFTHGRSIAVVSVDGKNARIVATSNVAGDGNTAVQFHESDPTFSPDGKLIVSSSTILSSDRLAPPALTIIDLSVANPKKD